MKKKDRQAAKHNLDMKQTLFNSYIIFPRTKDLYQPKTDHGLLFNSFKITTRFIPYHFV